jgi:hypothetical protein
VSAHTPGPWRIEGYLKWPVGPSFLISHGMNSYGDGPEGYICKTQTPVEADALLIAAAPDLLKALTSAADILEMFAEGDRSDEGRKRAGQYAQIARAAIAKAEGDKS